MLRSCLHLTGPKAFAALRHAPTLAKTEHFVLQGVPAVGGDSSLGLILPKKLAKAASRRNGLRREAYRAAADSLLEHVVVLRLYKPFAKEQFLSSWSDLLREKVKQEMKLLFLQLHKAMATPNA